MATIARDLGDHVSRDGGVAYVVDYGDWHSLGDTLQALRDHRKADVLSSPGAADLTAHVDFEAIATAARPARVSKLTTQGIFLERLGITQRANALAKGLTSTALESHLAAHRRLTHPDQMGTLFKVMAIYAADTPVPPGLDA